MAYPRPEGDLFGSRPEPGAMQGDYEEDDDPVCVCGVHASEHRLLGCSDGFMTAERYAQWKESLYEGRDSWQED